MTSSDPPAEKESLRARLDAAYRRYHRRDHVAGDPLCLIYQYAAPADREIAGLVAALLAYGAAPQIIRSASDALRRLGPSPATFLRRATPAQIGARMKGFRHRWTTGQDLAKVLLGVRRMLRVYRTLEQSFKAGWLPEHVDYRPALERWVGRLRSAAGPGGRRLLPDPEKGSACKRWHLFLRWMIRCDGVDPGVWRGWPAAGLIIPLDVHMARAARRMGLTRRRAADEKTAVEVTAAFRRLCPEDPTRWDFALTRQGMAGARRKKKGPRRRSLTPTGSFLNNWNIKSSRKGVMSKLGKPARSL